jgi:hypothetical protein
MQFSPKTKYEILEKFNNESTRVRVSFLRELMHTYQMGLYQTSVENLLNFEDQDVAARTGENAATVLVPVG